MNNYRPPQGYGVPPAQDPYQRPGSTTYGGQQTIAGAPGYSSPAQLRQSSQWPPPQNPYGPPQQQYQHTNVPPPSGQQEGAPAYNPNAYGPMSSQTGAQAPPLPPRASQTPQAYSNNPVQQQYQQQQQYGGQTTHMGQRPQVPSLPQGYQTEIAQNTQGWPQHPQYSQQPPTQRYEPQQNTYGQSNQQKENQQFAPPQRQDTYSTEAPPPPSKTPGGSYFPPSQGPAHPNQPHGPPPSHLYGVQAPLPPAFKPEDVASYQSSNPDPNTGGHIPSQQENVPTWSQQSHIQPDPSSNRLSYPPQLPPKQDIYGNAPPQQLGSQQVQQQYVQGQPLPQFAHYQAEGQPQLNQQHDQQPQYLPQTFSQHQALRQQQGYQTPSPRQTFAQPSQPPLHGGTGQHPPQRQQTPSHSSPAQTYSVAPPPGKPPNQTWPGQPAGGPPPNPAQFNHVQQPMQPPPPAKSQPQHGHSVSVAQQPYQQSQSSRTDEPVSPLFNGRQSFDRSSLSGAPSRSESQISRKSIPVSSDSNKHEPSIAEQETKPLTAKPGPSAASALGFGGPSDWEHFSMGADEIDDTAMYGTKSPGEDESHYFATVELPASPVNERSPVHERSESNISGPDDSWRPSPAQGVPAHNSNRVSVIQRSTPPPQKGCGQTPPPVQQGFGQHPPTVQDGLPQSAPDIVDDPDYIPPMPPTPPPAGARQSRPLIIGGSAKEPRPHAPLPHAASIVMDDGGWQPPVPSAASTGQQMTPEVPQQQPAQPPLLPTTNDFVMGGGGIPPQGDTTDQRAMPIQALLSNAQDQGLRQTQQEVQDLRARLTQAESTLAQKDTALAQKDSELEAKATDVSQIQAALNEMTQKWEVQKQMSDQSQEELKRAHAEHASVRDKALQAETALMTAKLSHDGEKGQLQKDLIDTTAALITAKSEAEELKEQLEEVKQKAAAPVDIAPGLDPWFKGSLERYQEMLQIESKPLPVQEKLQIYMDFVNSESRLRGIDLPFGPEGQVKGFPQQQQKPVTPPRTRERPAIQITNSKGSPDSSVFADQDTDVQYSPGGRPVIKPTQSTAQGNIPAAVPSVTKQITPPKRRMTAELPASPPKPPAYQAFRRNSIETPGLSAIATPTTVETPKVISPPPVVEQKPLAYKPFGSGYQQVEPVTTPPIATPVLTPPREPPKKEPIYKPMSGAWTAPKPIPQVQLQKRDSEDISAKRKGSVPLLKELGNASPRDETMLPEPLKPKTPAPPQPAAVTEKPRSQPTASSSNAVNKLADLLPPTQMPDSAQSAKLQQLRGELSKFTKQDLTFITNLTKTWETKAGANRSRLDAERRQRQAETEKRSNELYDDQEIGYGDFDTLERKSKEEEIARKAHEDMDEYDSYGTEVFEVVFSRLHEQTRGLQDLLTAAESVVRDALSGRDALCLTEQDTDLAEAMALLLQIHEALEERFSEIAKAVVERDRRYKLTQTKPLYARGDIAKMKMVERGFEQQERKGEVKAKVERAERCKNIWQQVETSMERGIGEDEDFAADILSAASSIFPPAEAKANPDVFKKARRTLEDVYAHTISVIKVFEKADMLLNECEYDVSVASARLKGDGEGYFRRLAEEKAIEDGKLAEESRKRLDAVDDALKDALERLDEVEGGGGKVEDKHVAAGVNETLTDQERLMRALEAAKRRNGEI